MSYNTPLLSNHLNDLNYSPAFMGLSMMIVSICYAFSLPVVQKMTQHITKRGVLFIGLFLQALGVLISGIEGFHTWYNPGFFVVIGLAIFGFATAMVTIPVMPEILDAIEEKQHSNRFDEQSLHNNLSGYFVVCQGLGESLGPFLSSIFESRFQFRSAQKIIGYVTGVFLVIYISSCGFRGFFSRAQNIIQSR
mmetsp:Transcript_17557/g.29632  ORF Transcript_17557/g.29632 Transcript_17557/m.29632 type:complete len:193 (+) Transcript_17557:1203-1781(+)